MNTEYRIEKKQLNDLNYGFMCNHNRGHGQLTTNKNSEDPKNFQSGNRSDFSFQLIPKNPIPYSMYWFWVRITGIPRFSGIQLSVLGLDGYKNCHSFQRNIHTKWYGLEVNGCFPGGIDRIFVHLLDESGESMAVSLEKWVYF